MSERDVTHVKKACAYITRDESELLVFEGPEHDGLQIPKGTVEDDDHETLGDIDESASRVTVDAADCGVDSRLSYRRFRATNHLFDRDLCVRVLYHPDGEVVAGN